MHTLNSPYFSIVIPVYGCSTCLNELYERLKNTLSPISENFEIIMVDDCGPDNSWERIVELSKKDKRIKGIRLSRNFGQHYAITAGLDISSGEWIVVMDCDLQDKPEEISKLYQEAIKGYDIVLASRISRKDKFLKKYLSKLFYIVLEYLTDWKQDHTVANFGIYNKKVINQIKLMRENIRFFPTMVKWVGFNSTRVEVEHSERTDGKSAYNISKRLKLAMNIILAYSDKPLRLLVKFGLLISFLSFIFVIIVLIKWYEGKIIVTGYTSLIISIWFLSGIIISTLGMVGLYVGKTFENVKNRPLYIIDKKTYED